MTEFEEGDRVRIKERRGWEGYEDGREAIVEYSFCEYGDHGLKVKFVDNGEDREFIDETMFEHVDDPCEYAVHRTGPDGATRIVGDFWSDKEDRQGFLDSMNFDFVSGAVIYKLVKRRKPGPVEDV